MFSKESNSFDDTLLNLNVGDQRVVVSQSESSIRNVLTRFARRAFIGTQIPDRQQPARPLR